MPVAEAPMPVIIGLACMATFAAAWWVWNEPNRRVQQSVQPLPTARLHRPHGRRGERLLSATMAGLIAFAASSFSLLSTWLLAQPSG